MSDLSIARIHVDHPPLDATMWHCSRCGALIAIHSSHIVGEAFCPVCVHAPLEFYGSLSGTFGFPGGDA